MQTSIINAPWVVDSDDTVSMIDGFSVSANFWSTFDEKGTHVHMRACLWLSHRSQM